ncbi:MAG: hypothetical protein GC168_13105 [Candidatus Hydrogenedens sp.]|nr:hypothetical protein [Candidatus Hydrogenedens sp.]
MAKWFALGAAALMIPWQSASADSIRVDKTWYQDVYVVVSSQFYQILVPETGEVVRVSRKRQDLSEPRFTKDEAEREALKAKWDEASKRKERQVNREAEVRSAPETITNIGEDGVPFLTNDPSPTLNYRIEDNLPNAPLPAMTEGEFEGEALPVPPGPREAPPAVEQMEEEGLSEEDFLRMQNEQNLADLERLRAQPYYLTEDEAIVAEELRRIAEQRMAEEAAYEEALRAQGYIGSPQE